MQARVNISTFASPTPRPFDKLLFHWLGWLQTHKLPLFEAGSLIELLPTALVIILNNKAYSMITGWECRDLEGSVWAIRSLYCKIDHVRWWIPILPIIPILRSISQPLFEFLHLVAFQ